MIGEYSESEGVTIEARFNTLTMFTPPCALFLIYLKRKLELFKRKPEVVLAAKKNFPLSLLLTRLIGREVQKQVKLIYSRAEDMANSTKRHPSESVHKMAVDKDGKIKAWEIDFYLDGGAYFTLSSVVYLEAVFMLQAHTFVRIPE